MNLSVVILAAGKGKRMKSALPKVLHEVLGRPMLQYVIDAVRPLKPLKTIVVIGNGAATVQNKMHREAHLSFVVQKQLLGTGDAVATANNDLSKGTLLVLNGDCPLITTKTLKGLLARHGRNRNVLSFLTFIDESMSGYGRIIRDAKGRVTGIVEDKHASQDVRKRFKELNGGVYVMQTDALKYLGRIKKNASSDEYYLTDIVDIVSKEGKKLEAYVCPSEEIRGVNTRGELQEIADIVRKRIIAKWMDSGVSFINPETTFIHPSVRIGKDTVIYPNVYLEGNTRIGNNCIIYPGARIQKSILGNHVTVKDNTLIEESEIGDGSSIGPFAHLRPHSVIGRNVKIGNFVEIKKSRIGNGTKASHLTYLGDAVIGKDVNIGAGTITCNYDGKSKFTTVIESGVFIGSDTQLVAPVKIGKGAYVGAGATVTKDVPPGSLAISRTKQQNVIDWVKKRQLRIKSDELRVKNERSERVKK